MDTSDSDIEYIDDCSEEGIFFGPVTAKELEYTWRYRRSEKLRKLALQKEEVNAAECRDRSVKKNLYQEIAKSIQSEAKPNTHCVEGDPTESGSLTAGEAGQNEAKPTTHSVEGEPMELGALIAGEPGQNEAKSTTHCVEGEPMELGALTAGEPGQSETKPTTHSVEGDPAESGSLTAGEPGQSEAKPTTHSVEGKPAESGKPGQSEDCFMPDKHSSSILGGFRKLSIEKDIIYSNDYSMISSDEEWAGEKDIGKQRNESEFDNLKSPIDLSNMSIENITQMEGGSKDAVTGNRQNESQNITYIPGIEALNMSKTESASPERSCKSVLPAVVDSFVQIELYSNEDSVCHLETTKSSNVHDALVNESKINYSILNSSGIVDFKNKDELCSITRRIDKNNAVMIETQNGENKYQLSDSVVIEVMNKSKMNCILQLNKNESGLTDSDDMKLELEDSESSESRDESSCTETERAGSPKETSLENGSVGATPLQMQNTKHFSSQVRKLSDTNTIQSITLSNAQLYNSEMELFPDEDCNHFRNSNQSTYSLLETSKLSSLGELNGAKENHSLLNDPGVVQLNSKDVVKRRSRHSNNSLTNESIDKTELTNQGNESQLNDSIMKKEMNNTEGDIFLMKHTERNNSLILKQNEIENLTVDKKTKLNNSNSDVPKDYLQNVTEDIQIHIEMKDMENKKSQEEFADEREENKNLQIIDETMQINETVGPIVLEESVLIYDQDFSDETVNNGQALGKTLDIDEVDTENVIEESVLENEMDHPQIQKQIVEENGGNSCCKVEDTQGKYAVINTGKELEVLNELKVSACLELNKNSVFLMKEVEDVQSTHILAEVKLNAMGNTSAGNKIRSLENNSDTHSASKCISNKVDLILLPDIISESAHKIKNNLTPCQSSSLKEHDTSFSSSTDLNSESTYHTVFERSEEEDLDEDKYKSLIGQDSVEEIKEVSERNTVIPSILITEASFNSFSLLDESISDDLTTTFAQTNNTHSNKSPTVTSTSVTTAIENLTDRNLIVSKENSENSSTRTSSLDETKTQTYIENTPNSKSELCSLDKKDLSGFKDVSTKLEFTEELELMDIDDCPPKSGLGVASNSIWSYRTEPLSPIPPISSPLKKKNNNFVSTPSSITKAQLSQKGKNVSFMNYPTKQPQKSIAASKTPAKSILKTPAKGISASKCLPNIESNSKKVLKTPGLLRTPVAPRTHYNTPSSTSAPAGSMSCSKPSSCTPRPSSVRSIVYKFNSENFSASKISAKASKIPCAGVRRIGFRAGHTPAKISGKLTVKDSDLSASVVGSSKKPPPVRELGASIDASSKRPPHVLTPLRGSRLLKRPKADITYGSTEVDVSENSNNDVFMQNTGDHKEKLKDSDGKDENVDINNLRTTENQSQQQLKEIQNLSANKPRIKLSELREHYKKMYNTPSTGKLVLDQTSAKSHLS